MKKPLSRLLAACALGLLASTSALAQDFPSRPIRMVVGFPPGGLADITARILSDKLGALWGQPVVVENRGGASGTIAADVVAKASGDGHTLLVILTNHVVTAAIQPKLSYDAMADFAPITLIGSSPLLVMAHPKVAASNMSDLIALAKAKPDTLTYSTPGDGSVHHLSQELFNNTTGIKLIHVPYKGGGPAMMDAVAGVVDLTVGSPAQSLAQVEGGKLKPLGYTGAQRSPLFPQVPTIAEAGVPGYSAALWVGVLAPARTPRPLVNRIQADIRRVVNTPEVRERMTKMGVEVALNTPEEFDKFMRSELVKWGAVAKRAGVKPE